MTAALILPLFAAALLGEVPANAEAQVAACAWKKAATSASTLVGTARFDKAYVYDAEGSPTVGPLMRIRAACADQISKARRNPPYGPAFGDTRRILKLLKQTRPRQAGPDLFDLPVTRCEYRFADSPPAAGASAVIWSYGEGEARKELSTSSETLGITLSAQELQAIASDKIDPSKLFAKLENVEPVRVATLAEGKASGKPYTLDLERGVRTCQRANSDGSYSDA